MTDNYIKFTLPMTRDWRFVRAVLNKHNIRHWINTKYFSIIIREQDYIWMWKQVQEDDYAFSHLRKQYKEDYENNKEYSDNYYLNQDSWFMLSVFFIRIGIGKWVR